MVYFFVVISCFLILHPTGSRRMTWRVWNGADTVYYQMGTPGAVPHSKVHCYCGLLITVNGARKWQSLDVVAQATNNPSWATQLPISPAHLFFSLSSCPYVWCTLTAITVIKNVLATELKRLLSTISQSLAACKKGQVIEPRRQNDVVLPLLL